MAEGRAAMLCLMSAMGGGCAGPRPAGAPPGPAARSAALARLDPLAERYVRLALALGEHDPDYVDAWYGPAAWREEAHRARRPLADVGRDADVLAAELAALPLQAEPLPRWRVGYLGAHLRALRARARLLGGQVLSFDDEALALYGVAPPHASDAELQAVVDALDRLLPGQGPVQPRYRAYLDRLVVPPARLADAMQLAIAECRARTLRHLRLPEGERFDVEFVTGRPWGAYNWYQGGFRSLIQVNTELPVHIGEVLSTACHEGYPGHHVANVLAEARLVRGQGILELAVSPLFAPSSMINEGTAEYGVELAFPETERLDFERRRLWPAAGLDPAEVERHRALQKAAQGLRLASTEAARRLLDGTADEAAVRALLVRYGLRDEAEAAQDIRFFRTYRSYAANYLVGRELVRARVEGRGGDLEARWRTFEELLVPPALPVELR